MVTIDMAVTPYQVKDGKNVKGSITPIEGGFIAKGSYFEVTLSNLFACIDLFTPTKRKKNEKKRN